MISWPLDYKEQALFYCSRAHRKIALGDGKLDITWEGDTISLLQQMFSYNFVLFDTQDSCFATTVAYFIV